MRDFIWEKKMQSMAARGGRELRGAIGYVNDRIVPAVRAEGFRARQEGARLLRVFADRVDAQAGQPGRRG